MWCVTPRNPSAPVGGPVEGAGRSKGGAKSGSEASESRERFRRGRTVTIAGGRVNRVGGGLEERGAALGTRFIRGATDISDRI
jgi:hypothetical protein